MKHDIIGRGFSREHVITGSIEDDPGELHAYLKEVSEDDTMQYLEPIDRARAIGTRYLESVELPSALLLYQLEPKGEWTTEEPPERADVAVRSLDLHIKALGYARDSLPDLAARLILEAEDAEREQNGFYDQDSETRQYKLQHRIFELGRLMGLWGAYLKVADGRRSRGKSKRKPWADAVAKKIRSDRPGATKDELWQSVSYLGFIIAGGEQWECYRDGDQLVAIRDYDGSEHKIAASTFKRHYLKGQ